MQRLIVCAAVLNLRTQDVLVGIRHGDHLMCDQLERLKWFDNDPEVQGFLDNKGAFYDRRDAWLVAEEAGQIKRRCGSDTMDGGTLFSENLY